MMENKLTETAVPAEETARRGLSGNLLKWIAVACMLVDHIAWAFVSIDSPLGVALHFVGRVTGPVMFFFIAEGYYHTRSVKRYALRLLAFALISWPCFSYFETGKFFTPCLGVIWTLLLGLLALWACDAVGNPVLRALAVVGCILLSRLGDWQIYGVLYILAFGLNRGNRKLQCVWYTIITIFMLLPILAGVLLMVFPPEGAAVGFIGGGTPLSFFIINLGVAVPFLLLRFYNGQRGGKPWMKWAFYVIYPAHLLLLGLLRWLVF